MSIIVNPTEKVNRMLSTLSKIETPARLRAEAIRMSKIPDRNLIIVTKRNRPL
jgi:hypothetical protein